MATETLNIKIKATDKASAKVSKVKGSMLSLKNAVIGVGVAYGAVKIKNFIKESIQLFTVQEKAEARLLSSIKNLKDLGEGYSDNEVGIQSLNWELKEYAKHLQTVTTVGDEETISAMAMLGSFQLTGEEIMKLTPALLDMKAATEKTTGAQADMNDLANAMGKALSTGAGALSRYGVVLSDAQKIQFDAAEGMERVALLAEIMGDNFGGAAEEIRNTTAGALTAAANDWGDFKETVGALLAPLLSDIAAWISNVAIALQEGMARLKELWDEDWHGIRTTLEDLMLWINEEFKPFMEDLFVVFGVALALFKVNWEMTWTAIKAFLLPIWTAIQIIILTTWETITTLLSAAIKVFQGDFKGAWNDIKDGFSDIWEGIIGIVERAKDKILALVDKIIGPVKMAINLVKNLLGVSGGVADVGAIAAPRAVTRAEGGALGAGQLSLVGERGAEWFVPKTAGNIIPNNMLGGVTININGIISSKEVAEEYADVIIKELKLSTKVV